MHGDSLNYFHIVGSGRSGTSLVRRLLDEEAGVSVLPETHLYDRYVPLAARQRQAPLGVALLEEFEKGDHYKRLNLDLSPQQHARLASSQTPEEFHKGLMSLYAAKHQATTVGDKTPAHHRHIPRLLSWGDARVIFVARDPRAVVSSLNALTLTWANGNSHEHAMLWRDAARNALRWQGHERVLLITYEELLLNHARSWQRVLNFLGLQGSAADRICDKPATHDGAMSAEEPLSQARIDAWSTSLSRNEAAWVHWVCAKEAVSFGYTAGEVPSWATQSVWRLKSGWLMSCTKTRHLGQITSHPDLWWARRKLK